jgi:mannose-6-phosphate isomerase-like protein (cupin superfamily)
MILTKQKSEKHENGKTCTVWEYPFRDNDIDISYAEINGRYPETGWAVNTRSKEAGIVISGSGILNIDGKPFELSEKTAFLVPPKTKYFFEGNLRLSISCSPAWSASQCRNVK